MMEKQWRTGDLGMRIGWQLVMMSKMARSAARMGLFREEWLKLALA